MKQKQEFECGFDLTNIDAIKFFKLLTKYKLTYTRRKLDGGAYVWGFKNGHIVTANDPLQGNYCRPEGREPEIGYASYIGITGTKAFCLSVSKYIKKNASYIKEFDPKRRQFI